MARPFHVLGCLSVLPLNPRHWVVATTRPRSNAHSVSIRGYHRYFAKLFGIITKSLVELCGPCLAGDTGGGRKTVPRPSLTLQASSASIERWALSPSSKPICALCEAASGTRSPARLLRLSGLAEIDLFLQPEHQAEGGDRLKAGFLGLAQRGGGGCGQAVAKGALIVDADALLVRERVEAEIMPCLTSVPVRRSPPRSACRRPRRWRRPACPAA